MSETEQNLDSYIENAPDPSPELEGEVKESETKGLKVEIDDVPNSSGELEEDGGAVVTKIKKEVLGESDSETKDEEDGKDIPDTFTEACLKQGWTKEEIIEFASDLDDVALLDLIPELLGTDEQKDSELGKDQAKQEDKSKAADDTAKKEPTNEEIASLKKELAEIKKQIGEASKEKSARETEVMFQTADQVFDEASKDFEIFGKTEELLKYPAGPKKGQIVPTSPAMAARNEVWAKAVPFIQNGIPVKDAMDIALTWYKGKYLEKDVQRNLIKDLKKHETKLSAKRSGKETVKVYENEDERKAEVVREAARSAGVKGDYGVE